MRYCEEPNCTKFGDKTENGKCYGVSIVSDQDAYQDLLDILKEKRNTLDRQMDAIAYKFVPNISDRIPED
jgi:hypothetical protein